MTKSKIFQQYKLKSGGTRWHVHAYLGTDPRTGQPKYFNHQGYKTKADAKDALDVATGKFKSGEDIITHKAVPTLQQVYDEWLPLYAEKVRPSTLRTVYSIWKQHIQGRFGRVYVDKITPADCQRWLNDLAKEYRSLNAVESRLHLMLNFAVRNGYITVNPLAAVEMPRKRKPSNHVKKNYFELDELKRFVDTAVDDYQSDHTRTRRNARSDLILLVVASTGMRNGEARGLRWQSIDFDTGKITIEESAKVKKGGTVMGDTKTPNSHRVAYAEGATLRLLRDWRIRWLGITGINPNVLMFSENASETEPPAATVEVKGLTRLCKKAKVHRITPHGLRHTKATLLAAAGVSAADIASVLGHADANFTQRTYIHGTEQGRNEAEQEFRKLVNL